jgi:acyl dehydratase
MLADKTVVSQIGKQFAPITRATLALYAGASGDHNSAHIDSDAARAIGFDDVFAQGMLVMAYAGQALTDAFPVQDLRSFQARFVAVTQLGASLRCEGQAGAPYEESGERRVRIDLQLVDQHGDRKLSAIAVVAI